jgi:hypothetical protein
MATVTAFGVQNFTIAGLNFDVAGDFTWQPNILSNEALDGMTSALQGIAQSPKAAYIETTIRNNSGLPVSFFALANGVPVAALFRDGTSFILPSAVWIGDDIPVEQKDGTIKLKFQCKTSVQA